MENMALKAGRMDERMEEFGSIAVSQERKHLTKASGCKTIVTMATKSLPL